MQDWETLVSSLRSADTNADAASQGMLAHILLASGKHLTATAASTTAKDKENPLLTSFYQTVGSVLPELLGQFQAEENVAKPLVQLIKYIPAAVFSTARSKKGFKDLVRNLRSCLVKHSEMDLLDAVGGALAFLSTEADGYTHARDTEQGLMELGAEIKSAFDSVHAEARGLTKVSFLGLSRYRLPLTLRL